MAVDSDASILRWQSRLLPFMICMIILSAVFFACVSIYQMEKIQAILNQDGDYALFKAAVISDKDPLPATDRIYAIQQHDSMVQSFRQSKVTILSNLWARFMAFTTGTILALVGAAFILGKLNESVTNINAESSSAKVAIATSSPGIVLSVLGTVLIGMALFARFDVQKTKEESFEMTIPDDVVSAAPGAPDRQAGASERAAQ